jgi:hypothetical protein
MLNFHFTMPIHTLPKIMHTAPTYKCNYTRVQNTLLHNGSNCFTVIFTKNLQYMSILIKRRVTQTKILKSDGT